ncbi:hypothetical protein B0A52_05577 [Exophiala mesophila]|uniref:SWR1-complex protein 4 n=1 Tax=Exophiala mesophila TaxID=212818 RepID=A0A438N3I2_EXOME|nr:hypothetical protein B0A52_05577 [Exophiala mesophila]
MASSSDIRDIMNLGQAGPRQPAPKKKKHHESQVRMTGINREIQALMGDSVPPIAIVDHPQYKSRPSLARSFVPRHWDQRSFKHGGRNDGLVLKHWKRAIAGSNRPPVAASDTDVQMTNDETSKQLPVPLEYQYEDEYPSHKWNVAVAIPSYNDDQYDSLLKSDDWSRQETDYLMDLCRNYDLRWLLIADRYDEKAINQPSAYSQEGNQPPPEITAQPVYPPRTMEALKSRYYGIAAKLMEVQTPASNMTQAEFQLWEKMRNFDVKTETLRKSMAEKLFERTKDEADEERILLEELYRITKNEDDFIKARKELYSRLEPVLPIRRTERGEEQSTAMYQTSAGLSMLLQSLLAKEKRMKRPAVPGSAESTAAAAATSTPTEQKQEKNKHANHSSRRDTTDTQAEDATPVPQKKGSAAAAPPNIRILTPQEETRFGVSRPQERLTSGVQFRHEKINRLTMAKSQTQTTKIQAALTELGIPARLLMPTERVCREFERLTTEINILLDARKVNEKLSSEIKVLEEARRIRLGLPKEGEPQAATTATTTATPAAPATASGLEPKTEPMEVDSSKVNEELAKATSENAPTADTNQDAKAPSRELRKKTKTPEVAERQASSTKDRQPKPQADSSKMEVDDGEDADAAGDAEGEDDADADADASSTRKKADADSDNDDEEDEEEQESGVANDSDNNQDDDDEDEEDEQEYSQAQVEEDDDDEEDDTNQLGVDEDEDEEEEEEDEDAESDPVVVAETPDEEDEDQDEEDAEAEAENDEDEDEDAEEDEEEEEEEEEADGTATPASGNVEQEDDDEEEEEAEEEVAEPPPPTSSTHLSATSGRGHKRSASVLSEASKAGSNRSGLGRKKRR